MDFKSEYFFGRHPEASQKAVTTEFLILPRPEFLHCFISQIYWEDLGHPSDELNTHSMLIYVDYMTFLYSSLL